MRLSESNLKKLLEDHANWLNGNGGAKINLRNVDMSTHDLSNVDLRDADLSGVTLRGTNFHNTDLRGAKLIGCDLFCADMSFANLSGTDLRYANISHANLHGAIDGHICRMDFHDCSVCIRSDFTSLDSQTHKNKKWLKWSHQDSEVEQMEQNVIDCWGIYAPVIKSAIEAVMAQSINAKIREG